MGFLEKIFGGHHGGGHGDRQRQGHGGSSRAHGHNDGNSNTPPSSDSAWGRSSQPLPPAATLQACGACNATNEVGARFCQQCGTSLLPITCSGCNTQLTPGMKFCGQCGKARAA